MSVTQWRRYHRILGLLMMVPMIGWLGTGLIFHGEIGYDGAYESLVVKTYPLGDFAPRQADPNWLEARYLRTCLGLHLLVRDSAGWRHLNATSGQDWHLEKNEVEDLLREAIAGKPRYGELLHYGDGLAQTSTGVRINVDLSRLSLYQSGRDTRNINRLWSIHRLKWTGVPWLDKTLGWVITILSSVLLVSGARLLVKPKKRPLPLAAIRVEKGEGMTN